MRFALLITPVLFQASHAYEESLPDERVEFRSQDGGSVVTNNCRVSIPSWHMVTRPNSHPGDVLPDLNLHRLCVDITVMWGPSGEHAGRVEGSTYNASTSAQHHGADIDCRIVPPAFIRLPGKETSVLVTYTVPRDAAAKYNVMTAKRGLFWGYQKSFLQKERKEKLSDGLPRRVCESLVPKLDHIFSEYLAGGYDISFIPGAVP